MIFRRKSEEQGDTEKSGITVESVLHALRDVKDPEIGRPLVELGMIRNVRVCGGQVALEVQLTTPACPLKATIEQDCRNAVMSLPGVEQVNIDWSSRVPQARRREQQPVPGVKHIVAVASGKEGWASPRWP
jgi:ATP-binding protein involved in chromosome partitioning